MGSPAPLSPQEFNPFGIGVELHYEGLKNLRNLENWVRPLESNKKATLSVDLMPHPKLSSDYLYL